MNLQKTKILRMLSKGILVLTGLFLLGFLGYTAYRGIKFRPYKVRVTNVTDSAFTVSWVTDSPMPGIVYYGEKNTFLPGPLSWLGKKKAVDDRDFSNTQGECISKFNEEASKNKDENFTIDASGFDCNDVKVWKYGKYFTHHVTVQNLDAEKEYFFRVGDGVLSYSKGKTDGVVYVEREIPEIDSFKQKTLPVITKVEAPNPAYGTSYNIYYRDDGTMGEKKNFDSLIFLKTFKGEEDLPYLSSVTNSSGGWTIDLANVRTADGTLVSMDGASLEFMPQVENLKPGAAGESNYEDTKFPLNLLGNSEDEWGEKAKDDVSSLLKFFERDIKTGNLFKKLVFENFAVGECQEQSDGKMFCKCSDGKWRLEGTCPSATKTCCTLNTAKTSCSCTSQTNCGGNYPYEGLDDCREAIQEPAPIAYKNITWGEPCVNTNIKCKCPDATIINIGSSCSTPKIGWGENCKNAKCICPDTSTITSGNSCSQQPIARCSDLKTMIIDPTPVRGGCQNGNNYCYLAYYHRNSNGTRGELCQYVKTTGASCGSKYCGDEKVLEISDKWIGRGEANCTNGSGCRCLDGSIAKLNTSCKGKESKVDCYMYNNLKGCYLAFQTAADNCKSQGGVAGQKACKENFTCTSNGVGELKDYINICTYTGGCTCPKVGSKSPSVDCAEKCFREEISSPSTLCAIYNTDTKKCDPVTNKNWCEDYREQDSGNYFSDLPQCKIKHPEGAINSNTTNNGNCYDSKNFALIDCKNCGLSCIKGDNALQQKLSELEKKGFRLVPIQIGNEIVQSYIKEDDYVNWLSNCISKGSSSTVEYSTISDPNKPKNGTPECPKVIFDYLAGEDIGDKSLYNYDNISKLLGSNFFKGLSFSAGMTALGSLLTSGTATVATAATTVGVATGAPVLAEAGTLLSTALSSYNVVGLTPGAYSVFQAMIAKALSIKGALAGKALASYLANPANFVKISSWLAGTDFVAGAPVLTAGGSAGTSLATVGGSTGTSLITTSGTVTTAGAGTLGVGGTILGGTLALAVTAFWTDLWRSQESVYEQCATFVDGVVTYTIQPKYCGTTQEGLLLESIRCECNGTRFDIKKNMAPVFDVKYYLHTDGSISGCAGSNCNQEGIQLSFISKAPITVGGKELYCCGGGKGSTLDQCCPGVDQYKEYCTVEWGQCVKVDTVNITGSLIPNQQKEMIAHEGKNSSNVTDTYQKNSQISLKGLLKGVMAEGSIENQQNLLLSDSGLYEVKFIGGEDSYLLKEGNTVLSYYIDRNGVPGYQTPVNPYEPKDNEDLAVTESSVIISAERQTSLQTLNLKKGINIISFKYVPTLGENGGTLTSDSFLKIANNKGNNVSSISFFSAGQWNGGNVYDFEKQEIKGVPFDLVVGKGYVIIADNDITISVPSFELTSSVPIAFSSGWNLVGVHGYGTAYTAKTFIESINTIEGLKANNVTWWPTSRGMYQGYQLQNGQEYGQAFPISPLNGYFVRISEFTPKEATCKSLIWNPGGEMNGKCGTAN